MGDLSKLREIGNRSDSKYPCLYGTS